MGRTARSKAASPPVAEGQTDDLALAERLAPALSGWFLAHARELPWRTDRTGYRVWVSEVMLQQTRVATVIPYYHRFLERFPTVTALAEADEATVLSLWSGLGYYRRARGLHQGAKEIVARFGGEMPATVDELLSIRGIGPYTAGAIASLAYGVRAPLVDGNVVRVFSRVFAIEEDMRRPAAQKQIWALAAAAVPVDAPGAFNEALMELGATVCLPRTPLCLACPLAADCRAREQGKTTDLPILTKLKAPKEVHAAALLALQGEAGEGDRTGAGVAVWLAKRRGDALFGGMWEPPMIEAATATEAQAALRVLVPEAVVLGEIVHVLSHRKMRVSVLGVPPKTSAKAVAYPSLSPDYEEARFVAEASLGEYGISTLARKVMAATAATPLKGGAKTRQRTSRAPGNRLGLWPCFALGLPDRVWSPRWPSLAQGRWRFRPPGRRAKVRPTAPRRSSRARQRPRWRHRWRRASRLPRSGPRTCICSVP
jgi:A/G-specific adenine glycosylase